MFLALAMLFCITTQSQNNISGIWEQDKSSDYYTVILNNNIKGYIFTNFSFVEQNIVLENFVEETNNYVKTVVHNPDNGWRVYTTYEYIDNNTLAVNYEGDYESAHIFYRKEIK